MEKLFGIRLEESDTTKAVKKAEKKLGIKGLAALVRYLIKQWLGE